MRGSISASGGPLHVTLIVMLLLFVCSACGSATAQAKPTTTKPVHLSDIAITNAVENELRFERAVNHNDIDVSTSNGIVTLLGTVPNLLAKDYALSVAETVRGARSVINRIEVVPPAPVPDDRTLAQNAESALFSDPATDSYEETVTVSNGIATLSGTVESYQERMLSERVVKGVAGIREVRNTLRVKPPAHRLDAEIEADVRARLRWDALVHDHLIDVEVNDGIVNLKGSVGSAAELRRASVDSWVVGTKGVENEELAVNPWIKDSSTRDPELVQIGDEQIENAVRSAILYDPRASFFDISVDSNDNRVTLRGTVDNLRAKQAAEQVARSTTGVTRVTSYIKVRPTEIADPQVEQNVRAALTRDPFVDRYEILVSANDGTVTLTGTVDSYFEKMMADTSASSVNGVKSVQNNLAVRYRQYPLAYEPYVHDNYPYGYVWYDYQPYSTFVVDHDIRTDIKDRLFYSPFVDSEDVKVRVEKGVATLSGRVDSPMEMRAAVSNAYEGGATWVDNKLTLR